jgi:hypothetical protein
LASWQIGHENPGSFIAAMSFVMGGTQYETPCQDGFCEAAQSRTWHPQDASSALTGVADGARAEPTMIAANISVCLIVRPFEVFIGFASRRPQF